MSLPEPMAPHRYNSGVYFDTYPGEAIGCCPLGPSHPIHDVPCPRCRTAHGVTYDCVQSRAMADYLDDSAPCPYCVLSHPSGTACPPLEFPGTEWDQ